MANDSTDYEPPLFPTSERCQVISGSANDWEENGVFGYRRDYKFNLECKGENVTDTTWQQSVRATAGRSFLDLPLEIRDVIYNYICDDLRRNGAVWSITKLECAGSYRYFDRGWPEHTQPGIRRTCAIMRTCRQVHAEFARMLYQRPLQIQELPDEYTLPISPSYAHLVRQILFIVDQDFHYLDQDFLRAVMISALHIAPSLVSLFPELNTLRLIAEHPHEPWNHDYSTLGVARELQPSLRGKQVAAAEQAIRLHQAKRAPKYIPLQLELVEVVLTYGILLQPIEDTPFCEAFRHVRDSQPGST